VSAVLDAQAEGAVEASGEARRTIGGTRIEWGRIAQELDAAGVAVLPGLLGAAECRALAELYGDESLFRSRIVMSRHGFGRGEYRYFRYPLPPLIASLRTALYPRLVPIANRWNELMQVQTRYPASHPQFIERCHAAGQVRPTPLLLKYDVDDYNCLHQDLYWSHVFPFRSR